MTENTSNQPQTTSDENDIVFQINAQYIKDLSFEAPAMPQALLSLNQPPEIQIAVDLKVNKIDDGHHYTVDLSLKIQANKKDDKKTLFLCELVYGGLVTAQAQPQYIQPLLMVEAPHLLFPYARAIVGNLVREAGFPSLQINPIDFAALYRAKLAEKQNENKGGEK